MFLKFNYNHDYLDKVIALVEQGHKVDLDPVWVASLGVVETSVKLNIGIYDCDMVAQSAA